MPVHILRNSHFTVLRLKASEVDPLSSALNKHEYQCGKPSPVDGVQDMVDVNVKKNGRWEGVSTDILFQAAQSVNIEVVDG